MQKISIAVLMQNDFGFEDGYIESIASNSKHLYKKIIINDKKRIDEPSLELKVIQCWISDFLRNTTPLLPEYVTAYEYGCSVIKNAQVHSNHSHILTLDISSFFHSCTEDLVRKYFETNKFSFGGLNNAQKLSVNDINLLIDLTCYRGSLSIGSPSSPAIANRLMLPIDKEIISTLDANCSYSRYSDDITISSDEWIAVDEVVQRVSEILKKYGFMLNDRKTHCTGKKDRRKITGVYLQPNGNLSIGRKRKNKLQKELYKYLVNQDGNPKHILGCINFAVQIEPTFVARLIAKYSNYGIAREKGVMSALLKR